MVFRSVSVAGVEEIKVECRTGAEGDSEVSVEIRIPSSGSGGVGLERLAE